MRFQYLAVGIISLIIGGCASAHMEARAKEMERPPFDPHAAQEDVANNEGRVKRDPKGAIGWSQLSSSYLALARATDNNDLALKSERAARTSLSIRRKNNISGAVRLAKAILEQHRFMDALAASEDAMKIDPFDISAHELHAEILVELGRYDDASKEIEKYALTTSTGLSGITLSAKLQEINGHPDIAQAFLEHACKEADSNWDMQREADAWFHQKLGLVLFDQGKNDEALREFQAAVNTDPQDFKSMGAMAKIYAATGTTQDAKNWAEKSVAIVPSVEVATLLLDIGSQAGDKDAVLRYTTMVDKISHPDLYKFLQDPSKVPCTKQHTHDRLYAVYCADHKINLPDALVAAKKDMAARKDIYAYDTMGWVLHQMGKDADAKSYMTKAMARGTLDAKLLYHAGMIDAALGNKVLAKAELSKALGINPAFQYLHNDLARKELASL
jgi:tetratricopeptide (TPR) repeat protein